MSNCKVSLHEFPFVGAQGVHRCRLPEGHGGVHACHCHRLLEHSVEARRAEAESQDFKALLDLLN